MKEDLYKKLAKQLDDLPGVLETAATAAINVPGYAQPAVTIEPPQLTLEEQARRDAAADVLRRVRPSRPR